MSEWMPIETAPRDGSNVLVFVPQSGEQFVAHHKRNMDWVYALGQFGAVLCEPTHWMPLPEPPCLS